MQSENIVTSVAHNVNTENVQDSVLVADGTAENPVGLLDDQVEDEDDEDELEGNMTIASTSSAKKKFYDSSALLRSIQCQ